MVYWERLLGGMIRTEADSKVSCAYIVLGQKGNFPQ